AAGGGASPGRRAPGPVKDRRGGRRRGGAGRVRGGRAPTPRDRTRAAHASARRRLSLELFADFADEGDGVVDGEVRFRGPQPLDGETCREGGERREATLLCMGGDARELEQLPGDVRL